MLQKTLLIDDPSWHAAAPPAPVLVHWIVSAARQHLIVDAPNWANGKRWGAQAALLAWQQLAVLDGAGPAPLNPCDNPGLHIWVVVPGFPVAPKRLWEEPFTRYSAMARNPALVYPYSPAPGTPDGQYGNPIPVAEALLVWGEPVPLLAAPV